MPGGCSASTPSSGSAPQGMDGGPAAAMTLRRQPPNGQTQGQLVLLRHFLIYRPPLLPQAARTPGQCFDQPDGELTADGRDRVQHMPLRPHWQRPAAGRPRPNIDNSGEFAAAPTTGGKKGLCGPEDPYPARFRRGPVGTLSERRIHHQCPSLFAPCLLRMLHKRSFLSLHTGVAEAPLCN